jgi:hypothetical protein
VPISFMHEQSETLAELDHELRAFAEDPARHSRPPRRGPSDGGGAGVGRPASVSGTGAAT